jgi:Tol biopolymer transport system component
VDGLDVSPDGRELVFDLLGDLYTLPIARRRGAGADAGDGVGHAAALQPGWAVDRVHQRSRRRRQRVGGGAAGGEPRQVTKEDFRLVNSPVWSPDGNFIAVRKHFTKHRSLGAGEIWLYHVSGGKGVQMTEKQNDQKDVGEPAFSPDGVMCTTARTTRRADLRVQQGPVRRDLRDQAARAGQRAHRASWSGGPGGAARPTPSPDGKSLAFIRGSAGRRGAG